MHMFFTVASLVLSMHGVAMLGAGHSLAICFKLWCWGIYFKLGAAYS